MKPTIVSDLTFDELKACYIEAVEVLKLGTDVPVKFVELASICSKLVVDKLCLKNGLKLSKEETLASLVVPPE